MLSHEIDEIGDERTRLTVSVDVSAGDPMVDETRIVHRNIRCGHIDGFLRYERDRTARASTGNGDINPGMRGSIRDRGFFHERQQRSRTRDGDGTAFVSGATGV